MDNSLQPQRQSPNITRWVFNKVLDCMLVGWIVYLTWSNLTCECRTRMFAITVVDKTEMWLSTAQNYFGLCLPFKQSLLFAVMRNQYKIAVIANFLTLFLAVLFALRIKWLAGPLANLLLIWTAFASFDFDIYSGEILKVKPEQYQDALYLLAIIGGLHIRRYRQMSKMMKMRG